LELEVEQGVVGLWRLRLLEQEVARATMMKRMKGTKRGATERLMKGKGIREKLSEPAVTPRLLALIRQWL
jgi:hypothetical protein